MSKFSGKTALITGGSSGIGLAIANELAEQQCHLILVARRLELLNKAQQEINIKHPNLKVQVIAADLTADQATQNLFAQVEDQNVDILINNAGFGSYGDFVDIPLETHLHMMHVNMQALTELTHLFGKQMKTRGSGYIMLTASIGGFIPSKLMAIYCASKAYVLSLGESLHHELKAHGVSLTILSPGMTETEFFDHTGQDFNFLGRLTIMSAERCAKLALKALAKGKVQYVTGISNKVLVASMHFVPRRWKANLAGWFLNLLNK